jgi:hypothetical protein
MADSKVLGNRRVLDQLANFSTDGVKVVMPFIFGTLDTSPNFDAQVVVFQENDEMPGR